MVTLLSKLDDEGFDNYMMVPSLIGVEFDENTPWGFKCRRLKLICLAIGELEYAEELTKAFLNFNDNKKEESYFIKQWKLVFISH